MVSSYDFIQLIYRWNLSHARWKQMPHITGGIIIPKQVLDLSSMGEDDVLCVNDHVLHEDRDWEVHGDSWAEHDSDGGTCNRQAFLTNIPLGKIIVFFIK